MNRQFRLFHTIAKLSHYHRNFVFACFVDHVDPFLVNVPEAEAVYFEEGAFAHAVELAELFELLAA